MDARLTCRPAPEKPDEIREAFNHFGLISNSSCCLEHGPQRLATSANQVNSEFENAG